jgi:hypothetical protein
MTVIDYAPVAIFVVLVAAIACEVVAAVVRSRQPSSPEDGCCGCGKDVADVVLECGEAYCWACIDTWPAEATPLDELGATAFIGRERGVR